MKSSLDCVCRRLPFLNAGQIFVKVPSRRGQSHSLRSASIEPLCGNTARKRLHHFKSISLIPRVAQMDAPVAKEPEANPLITVHNFFKTHPHINERMLRTTTVLIYRSGNVQARGGIDI